MASADSTENLPTTSCGKRSIKDTDEHVSSSQKRLDRLWLAFLLVL